MTREDLDRLAALVAASNTQSADDAGDRPWRVHEIYAGDIVDRLGACVAQDVPTREDRDVLIALYNAAPDLLSLAREALEARETYRLEARYERPSAGVASCDWERCGTSWAGLRGIEAARAARGWCAESHGTPLSIRIVRERDGEVVE